MEGMGGGKTHHVVEPDIFAVDTADGDTGAAVDRVAGHRVEHVVTCVNSCCESILQGTGQAFVGPVDTGHSLLSLVSAESSVK